jgi:energy-coupling factor transport system ATP-binding protein
MQNIRFQEKKGEDLRWITITILFLAIGVILRMVSPNIGGISLNWNIVMYTLAIMLCRPSAKQGFGIGIVSGLVATMSSKAAIPYVNLVSDPLAALLCAMLAGRYVCRIRLFRINLEPVLLVFVTTFISGGSFVLLTKIILSLPMNVFLFAMLPVVLLVACLGAVAGQLLYHPADRIFNATASNQNQKKFSMKNVNAVIPKGSFTVVTGANGEGKTSLLLTIAGARMDYFEDMKDSRLVVNGIDILESSREILKSKAGMVMADYEGQLVTENVGDEIDFSLENAGYTVEKIQKRRQEVLEMTGLAGFGNRKIVSLSGGQKQRLAIAVMLALHTDILLLDEPVAAIDPEGAREIYTLLEDIREKYGTTIITAEHDLKYVLPYATQMLVLEDGGLKIAGTMQEGMEYMYEHDIYAEAIPLQTKIYLELGELS